jgi:hypothetical protein
MVEFINIHTFIHYVVKIILVNILIIFTVLRDVSGTILGGMLLFSM